MGAIHLSSTGHVLRITTDGSEALDCAFSFVDWVSGTPFTPDSEETLITASGTTDIVSAPAASTVRMVGWGSITNTSATSANVIVNLYDGSNDHELGTFDLGENETLIFYGQKWFVSENNALQEYPVQGRLTLTSGTAITTSDVTAATTWYFTPYKGNRIALYDTDSSKWKMYTFSEIILAVVASTDTNYDLFIYDNSGALTLEAVAWTNDTTRATAISLQDGIYCKSGSLDRRYLGSVRTTGTSGQCEDSESRRFVWNYYNRVPRVLDCFDSTDNWSYTTATWRAARAVTTVGTSRVEILIGVSEDVVRFENLNMNFNTSTAIISGGIGISSTSINSARLYGSQCTANSHQVSMCVYEDYPGIGYNYVQRLEHSQVVGTTYWHGDTGSVIMRCAMSGIVKG